MKKTLKAEMWDRMQFLFRNFYDRMVHLKLHFDGKIDIPVLKNAIIYMVESAPVLHSSFVSSGTPHWQEEKYTIDDIFSHEICENPSDAADEFLAGSIDYFGKVQIKIAVFEGEKESVFALLVNHMCMDGGDLKYFIATLSQNYDKMKRGDFMTLSVKHGSRSFEQVYSLFDEGDRKTARGLYKNVSKSKEHIPFPWAEARNTDVSRIVKREIGEDVFSALHKRAKELNVTVNDALMATVICALYDICHLDEHSPLTVSCAVDLRRHIIGGGREGGMTNHTAWLACRVLEKGESVEDTLVNVLRSMRTFKRDKFMGLYSLPLLRLAYTIFPPSIAEFAIKLGYDNPLLAVSNMGRLPEVHFEGATLTGGFITGATKYKPYFLMSATTLLQKLTLSTAIRGSEEDVKIANEFFDLVERYINILAFPQK